MINRNEIPTYKNILSYCYDNFSLSYKIEERNFYFLCSYISINKNSYKDEILKIENTTPTFHKWKSWEFPIFTTLTADEYTEQKSINFDVILNVFILLSGCLELNNNNLDEHQRISYEKSLQKKFEFLKTPVVNIYYEIIYEIALNNNINISRIKSKSPIVFTHDIDQLRSGWLEDLRYDLMNFKLSSLLGISKSIVIKLFNLKDSYYRAFYRMLEIDEQNNLNSISFFMAKKSHKDGDYDIRKKRFRNLYNSAQRKTKCEFHPGYSSSDSNLNFKRELNLISEIKGSKVTKVRQHFLKFNMHQTPKIHERFGIEEDYSLGFVEMYGFKNSIANPFYLFNFEEQRKYNTIEVPLFFMDSTIIDYIKSPIEIESKKLLDLTTNIINDFNCNFSVLFHNSAFTTKKYNGFIKLYTELILISKKNGRNS